MQDSPAAKSEAYNVVVVGGGYFANFHINAWRRLEGANLVAIVEQDSSKHTVLKEKLSNLNSADILITDSLSDVLSTNTVDIVDIATPPSSHTALITEAVARRCPYVICQKPFCGTYNAASDVYSKTKSSTSTIIVHENFRFQPWYRAIKSELEQESIGSVLQATFRLRPGDGQGSDAYLERQPYFREMDNFLIHETGVHYIDVFRYLFGEPASLSAELQRLNPAIAGEDSGHFIFYYDNGLRVHFDGNRLLDHAAVNPRLTMGEMLIEGTEGSLALYGNGDLLHRKSGEKTSYAINYPFKDNDFGGDCVYYTQQHVISHIRDGTPLENRIDEYLRNLELEALVYKAAASQSRLECPL